jgi:hypothetical protein
MGSKRAYRLAVVAALTVAMQACAVHHVSRFAPATAENRLVAGDEVIVALKTGKKYKAVVVSMDDTELVTEGGRYPWKDVDHITIKKVDWVGTTFEYVALHLVVAGAVYLIITSWFE